MPLPKRTKATNAQRRYTRKAGAGAYAKMVEAASQVVITNRARQYRSGNPEYVLFEFPHWCSFPDDFPKGFVVERTLISNTYKINAVKLLNWLYKEGHSGYNANMLVKQTTAVERILKGVDKLLEGEL